MPTRLRPKATDNQVFSRLSQHKQRDLYVRLKSKIQATRDEYGPNFTSHLVLNEPGRPELYDQSFEFYFLGLDGHTIWNCHLETAASDYWEKMDALAFEKSWELYCEDDDISVKDGFIPVYCHSSGRLLHYTMREQPSRPEFGGKTRSEFVSEYAEKLIQEDTGNTAPVFQRFEIHKDYAYGFGLHAVVDCAVINRETIEAMITHFQSFGEQAWQDVKPVERCKLPSQSFAVLLKQHALDKKEQD